MGRFKGIHRAHSAKPRDSIQELQSIGIGQRPIFMGWLNRLLKPYLGRTVLHLNAGQGGLAAHLSAQRQYTACTDADYQRRHEKAQKTADTAVDPNATATAIGSDDTIAYDTVLWPCSMRQLSGGSKGLQEAAKLLAPYGRVLVLLFPDASDSANFTTAAAITHEQGQLDSMAQVARLQLRQCVYLNRLGPSRLLAALRSLQVGKNRSWYHNVLDRIQFRGAAPKGHAHNLGVHRLLVLVHQPHMSHLHL